MHASNAVMGMGLEVWLPVPWIGLYQIFCKYWIQSALGIASATPNSRRGRRLALTSPSASTVMTNCPLRPRRPRLESPRPWSLSTTSTTWTRSGGEWAEESWKMSSKFTMQLQSSYSKNALFFQIKISAKIVGTCKEDSPLPLFSSPCLRRWNNPV